MLWGKGDSLSAIRSICYSRNSLTWSWIVYKYMMNLKCLSMFSITSSQWGLDLHMVWRLRPSQTSMTENTCWWLVWRALADIVSLFWRMVLTHMQWDDFDLINTLGLVCMNCCEIALNNVHKFELPVHNKKMASIPEVLYNLTSLGLMTLTCLAGRPLWLNDFDLFGWRTGFVC